MADLLAALLKLKPTGATGFEGLLAVVLGKIAGQDFRLAASGRQSGKDGATLALPGAIAFEAKLYKGKIPKNEVLGKIPELIASTTPPDLWVLGATVEASTQLVDTLQASTAKSGIGLLVLDWPATSPLPPLAAACAYAPYETLAFLRRHVTDTALVDAAATALPILKASAGYLDATGNLVQVLQAPSLALTSALEGNRRWLVSAFSDRLRAKAVFGQVLAPAAPGPFPAHGRPDLANQVEASIMGALNGEIIALIGREGNGKSWLFAQSWLGETAKPLTVVIRASELRSVAAQGSIRHFLISKFIEQTNDHDLEMVRQRWSRRLSAWGPRAAGEAPRFVIVVDGLNEQPEFDWPRWLDSAASVVVAHGGVLVITAREAYFADRIRSSLLSRVETITVPEWSVEELRQMLRLRGIDPDKLTPAVCQRLRNPRILGIAFELLDNVEIEAFYELTVERLLFEHIRVLGRLGVVAEEAPEFVKRLADHAREIMDRTTRQHPDDLLVFEQTGQRHQLTRDGLAAVAAEHFFQPLTEDPTLYRITEDGLSLALGLAILKSLQQAARAERSIDDALSALIDPIAALDKTAEAVFSAVLVASIDEQYSDSIRRALTSGLLRMQNISSGYYPAFVAAVRRVPDAAMAALFDLSIGDGYVANRDWLVSALRESRMRSDCWAAMQPYVSRWLCSYSMDPTLGVFTRRSDDEVKYLADLNAKTVKLQERYQKLPVAERTFLDAMTLMSQGDPSRLHDAAIELLAGMPLKQFAKALVACAYSISFNSSIGAPYDAFYALLRFNPADWSSARIALLDAASFIRNDEASSTGQWALVSLLRGTSTAEDAAEADQLVERLTADREKYEGWRRIETYCATDPCDPDAERPDNISKTADSYRKIKLEEVNNSFSMGSEDHFLRDARPGLARFDPDTAVSVQRAVAAAVVERALPKLERGILAFQPHAAVLGRATVAKLQELAIAHAAPLDRASEASRDKWRISQFSMVLAMPHLSGDEQLDFMRALPPHGPHLVQLADGFKPASSENVDELLEVAHQSDETARKIMALSYVSNSGSQVSARGRAIIARLVEDAHSPVRALAMEAACALDEQAVIERIAQSGWGASQFDPKEQYYEVWHGSFLLIRAAELGLVDPVQVVERISPVLYSHAVRTLGSVVEGHIAARLLRSMQLLLKVPDLARPPAVELRVTDDASKRPPLYSLIDPTPEPGVMAAFERLSEGPEAFEARQRAGWESFSRFEAELTEAKARLAIEDVGYLAVNACVSAGREEAIKLAEQLLAASPAKLAAVENFGLRLARSLSGPEPVLARRLFDHLLGQHPYVTMTFGMAGTSLEALSIWGSASSPEIDELRTRRLDKAGNDHVLAIEVLAALEQDASDFLIDYARIKLASERPSEVSRGLMVIGFGLPSTWSQETLSGFSAVPGMVGVAAKAAQYAYERNTWAQHWYNRMTSTASPEEFWCMSALFLKIVDGRFDVWKLDSGNDGPCVTAFGRSLEDRLRSRISSWKSKRERKLFGDEAPGAIFLEGM